MKQILVPIDFSEITGRILTEAARVAEHFNAHLCIIHVAPPDPDFVGYDPGPQSERDQVAARFRKEHQQLQQHAADLKARGLDATALLVQGPTVAVILDEADRRGADLIVLGSHGHGALYRALMGSVSEGILRKTKIPLLIVPKSETK